ncbi:MAG: TetR/AcrR family transcriptional regulator [Polyangia bacterium]
MSVRRRSYLPADARRAQLLDAAKRVFARRGYAAANIADICKEARVARGTIYQYFRNKRDVLIALFDDVAARVAQVLADRPAVAVPRGTPLDVDLIAQFCRARLREMLAAVFADEAILRLLLRDARGLDGVVDRAIAKIDGMILREMESDIRVAQAARIMRKVPLKLAARYLLGGVEKMILDAIAADETIDIGTIVDTAVELQLFGILHEEVRR